ncbi:MAG: hypothetical protein ABWX96_00650, partial [Propionibacteriaceae bacterium]
ASWTTLGAGRRASVGSFCEPQVVGGRVVDWSQRVAAAAANRGDARLGTLAEYATGCVAAVGPGAAVAAAEPDGSVASYATGQAFLTGGAKLSCPITLVDAGSESDAIIATLATRPDVTLFVTGIGPDPGSDDPGMQAIYRIGTTIPGWLTSSSTQRDGIVTLPDLTRTLIDFQRTDGTSPGAIDGAPLQVDDATLTVAGVQDHLRAVTALSDAAVAGYLILGAGGAILIALMVVGFTTGRFLWPRLVTTLGCVLGAAMMLTGLVRWYDSDHPAVVVGVVVWTCAAVLTAAAIGLARWQRVPIAVAGAALTVVAFTVEAALGTPLEPGSLLNSRPVAGARWYGYGNVTFSVYATAGLVLAGYVADRFRRRGRRGVALIAVAVIGFGVVLCEGWPTMGTDFGGVIALTPGVLWLLLVLSGLRVTWVKVLAVGAGAVLAIALISYLDWRRGPTAWTHLGNFVQRIIDGDAFDIVSRKAVTALETIVSPVGIGALVIGVALWVLMFRRIVPVVDAEFATLRQVAVAVLATAILGTVLNDGGIYVWLVVTSVFSLTVGSLWVDRALTDGHLTWVGRASR